MIFLTKKVVDITGLLAGQVFKSPSSRYGGSGQRLYSGKQALYGMVGQKSGAGKAIYSLPYSDPSQFKQIFDGSALKNIYALSVFADDSGDKLAIAGKNKSDKHVIILLDGTNKKTIEVGENEVRNLQRIR